METATPNKTDTIIDAPKATPIASNTGSPNLLLKNHFNSVLTEPTKYLLLATFLLYFTGFIIWHFYLANYGIAGVGFLQVEYISAALCFLFIFFSLSVPPFLFVKILGKTIQSGGGILNFYQWDKTYGYTIIIWYFLNDRLIKLFLPTSELSIVGFIINLALNIFFVIHCIFGIFLAVKAGMKKFFMSGNDAVYTEQEIAFKKSKLFKYGNPLAYWPIYFLLQTLVSIFFNSQIDKLFIFVTMAYWLVFYLEPGIHIKEIWPKSGLLLRCMICIGLFLSFIIYIRIFSVNQFSKIPKSVGGGMPEIVYLTFSDEHSAVAELMNLHQVKTPSLTNSLFGPVGVILKTQNEITFLNYSETNLSIYFTNKTYVYYTTNFATPHIGQTNMLAGSLITNKVNELYPNVFYNNGGLAARQMRLDLIDGIIYNR